MALTLLLPVAAAEEMPPAPPASEQRVEPGPNPPPKDSAVQPNVAGSVRPPLSAEHERLGPIPPPELVSGGPDPSLHPPMPPSDDDSEPFFFSWEFINALFAIILIVEFVVFPVLFKMWFFSKSSEVNEN